MNILKLESLFEVFFSPNAKLLAAITHIKNDNNLMNDFEVVIAYILSFDPIANSKTSIQNKVTIADSISRVALLSRRDKNMVVNLQFHT